MSSSVMRRNVTLVITDVSEERIASIFRVERTSELETKLTITNNSADCKERWRSSVAGYC
jgi:hypothetical protein